MDRVIQPLGDFNRIFEGDVPLATFNKADEVRSQAGVLGQLFLGPTPFEAQLSNVASELFDDCFFVHIFNLGVIRRFYHSLLVVFGAKNST